jgi:GMP synthase (glutamine-hydrolysing)
MKRFKLNPKDWILAQGTIYPDTIESGGTKHADKIKTHHNRVKEVLEMISKGMVVEPLKDLYKDEVRLLGRKIGLPNEIVDRHPFPGPGLSIRMVCSRGDMHEKNLNKLNSYLDTLMTRYNYENKTNIAGYVMPIRSVGVQGDERSYAHPAVFSGMLSVRQMQDLGPMVTNQIHSVNRVCLTLFSRKAENAGGKNKQLLLTKKNISLLQRVDDIVQSEIERSGLDKKIWQFPVVLAPYSIVGGYTIILRPVQSEEAMTVKFFPLPELFINRIVNKLKRMKMIDLILYDFTNKPPGTIEWE